MSVTRGEEQYLCSHAGVVLREDFSVGLVMTWERTFQKGAARGEDVTVSLWGQKELMFHQSIRTYHDGCQIFQYLGVSACFCLKWDYSVLQWELFGLSADMLHPSLGVCSSCYIFRGHLSKLPSTHSGWTSRWIKISPQRCGEMPVAEIVPNLGQVIPNY